MFIHRHLLSFTSMLILGALVIFPVPATAVDIVTPTLVKESMMIPILSDGETIRLKVRILRPSHDRPVPTVIFHHGSAGRKGVQKNIFHRQDGLIYHFSRRGWAIVMPSRRGQQGSEGRFRAQPRGECNRNFDTKPFDWALDEIDQVTTKIIDLPFVDPDMVVVTGQSRGGMLAILHASKHPTLYQGVINYAGTWLPQTCVTARQVHKSLLSRPVEYKDEMLWLYSPGDTHGSVRFQQFKLDHFMNAAGTATLVTDFSRKPGHYLISAPDEWDSVVDAYLQRHKLPHTQLKSIVARITRNGDPIPLDAYLGTWTGKWSSTDPAVLHIENITPSGKLEGYTQYKRKKKRRFSTTLTEQGVLYTVNKPGKLISGFYLNQDMTMQGHFQTPSFVSRAYLTHPQPSPSVQSAPKQETNQTARGN